MPKISINDIITEVEQSFDNCKDSKYSIEQQQEWHSAQCFRTRKLRLDEIRKKVEREITLWRQKSDYCKRRSFKPNKVDEAERAKIVRYHKLGNTVARIAAVASLIFLAFGASALALGVSYVDGGVTLSYALKIKIISSISVGLVGGALFGVFSSVIGHAEIHRKKRVLLSQNFHTFVEMNKIEVNDSDICDSKLHQIYIDWKRSISDL